MTRGPSRSCAIACTGLVFLCGIMALLSQPVADAANPAFVQARSKQITTGTVNSLAFTNANAAGNLIVVYVVWDNSNPVTLRDTRGNTYASVAPPTAWGANGTSRSQVFYAKDVASGTNTVTATFQGAITSFGRLYIHEYSGLDRTAPLDVSGVSTGTARAMDSGSATTVNANDVIFGAGSSTNNVTANGTGFTQPDRGQDGDDIRPEQRNRDAERHAVGHAHGRLQGRYRRPQCPDGARRPRGDTGLGQQNRPQLDRVHG